jgi:hypothetical protein
MNGPPGGGATARWQRAAPGHDRRPDDANLGPIVAESSRRGNVVLVQCCANPPEPSFDERESKLLRLALCPAAKDGEIRNSAVALISSWRRRNVTAEQLLGGHSARELALSEALGRHKGKTLREIPTSYLRWAEREASCLSPALRAAIRLVLAEGGVR